MSPLKPASDVPGTTIQPNDDPSHATALTPEPADAPPLSSVDEDAVLTSATPGREGGPVEESVRTPGAAAVAADDWLELQGRFVDDPAAAVREAGQRLERELAELRRRSESGDTEALRAAFQRYRTLHDTLR